MSGSLRLNDALEITWNRLYIVIFTMIVFSLILLVLKRTRLGLDIRAVSQNRAMAKAMGIRTECRLARAGRLSDHGRIVALDPNPAVPTGDPLARNPSISGLGHTVPASREPFPALVVPRPMAPDPNIARSRAHRNDLDPLRGRLAAHDDLGAADIQTNLKTRPGRKGKRAAGECHKGNLSEFHGTWVFLLFKRLDAHFGKRFPPAGGAVGAGSCGPELGIEFWRV